MHSGTFWVVYGYKMVDFQIDDRQTDTETGIRTCRAASLQLKILISFQDTDRRRPDSRRLHRDQEPVGQVPA